MILSSTLLRSKISDLKSESSIESEYNLDKDNSVISNITLVCTSYNLSITRIMVCNCTIIT